MPDQHISLTERDGRLMATCLRGSGVVGHNVQTAVDTEHLLIVAPEVRNSGSDRTLLANMGKQAKTVLGVDKLEAVADITVTLPTSITSGAKAAGRFGKQHFV